jgi:hypothetical protein
LRMQIPNERTSLIMFLCIISRSHHKCARDLWCMRILANDSRAVCLRMTCP